MGILSLYCFLIFLVVSRQMAKHLSLKYLRKDSMLRKIWIDEETEDSDK